MEEELLVSYIRMFGGWWRRNGLLVITLTLSTLECLEVGGGRGKVTAPV